MTYEAHKVVIKQAAIALEKAMIHAKNDGYTVNGSILNPSQTTQSKLVFINLSQDV